MFSSHNSRHSANKAGHNTYALQKRIVLHTVKTIFSQIKTDNKHSNWISTCGFQQLPLLVLSSHKALQFLFYLFLRCLWRFACFKPQASAVWKLWQWTILCHKVLTIFTNMPPTSRAAVNLINKFLWIGSGNLSLSGLWSFGLYIQWPCNVLSLLLIFNEAKHCRISEINNIKIKT